MDFQLWHGTNQDFTAFDPAMLGLNTDNVSSRRAFFFAESPETATEYARFAERNLIPNQVAHEARVREILERAARAAVRADHDTYERLIQEAEDLDLGVMNAEPSGGMLLRCELKIDNPFEIDAAGGRLFTNIDEIMDQARAAGHDALIIRNIHDTPSGLGPVDTHVAVFSADRIRILERQPLQTEPQNEPPFA